MTNKIDNNENIVYDYVLPAIFTQINIWVPKRDLNPQPSDRPQLRWLNVGCISM